MPQKGSSGEAGWWLQLLPSPSQARGKPDGQAHVRTPVRLFLLENAWSAATISPLESSARAAEPVECSGHTVTCLFWTLQCLSSSFFCPSL